VKSAWNPSRFIQTVRPVSPRVNNVRNNGPELLEALPPDQVAEPLQLDLLAGPNPQ